MIEATVRDPVAPTVDGGGRGFDEPRELTYSPEVLDDFVAEPFHAKHHAIIETQSQVISCDNRVCDSRNYGVHGRMDAASLIATLKARVEDGSVKQVDVADALGISADKVSKIVGGIRRLQVGEAAKLHALLSKDLDISKTPDLPGSMWEATYVDVEVVPSFGGMGGGGTGEGDRISAKLPRRLIEEELRGTPADFELIDVRGDSMQPDFQHGDQILIDRRDRNPRQPGPFALWDADGYVVKLVERIAGRRGWYRVFSANPRYSSYEVEETEATIRGRPVWFARRL